MAFKTVISTDVGSLEFRVNDLRAWPSGQHQTKLKRKLLVDVPASALVQTVAKFGGPGTAATLADANTGQAVDLWTAVAPTTLKAERGDDLALSASLVSLVSP